MNQSKEDLKKLIENMGYLTAEMKYELFFKLLDEYNKLNEILGALSDDDDFKEYMEIRRTN